MFLSHIRLLQLTVVSRIANMDGDAYLLHVKIRNALSALQAHRQRDLQ